MMRRETKEKKDRKEVKKSLQPLERRIKLFLRQREEKL